MEFKDYYKIMGLERSATQEEIKRAYRKLARKYHPDVSKEADAENKFKALVEAYEVLKDPKNRAQYDKFGQNWQQAHAHSKPQYAEHPAGGFHQHASRSQDFDPNEFEAFINSIFGQGNVHRARSHPHAPAYDQGQDVYAKLNVSLEESFHGAEKLLQLQMPQTDLQGNRVSTNRTIKVKIPKGIGDKQQIRLKNQASNQAQQPAGDLYIEINLLPHPWFVLKDKDIYLQLPITPWEAALGATITVPTLGGPVKLKIPKLSQAGKQLRLKGKGLPAAVPGDQYVTLEIVIPEQENEAATQLYQAMAKTMKFNPRGKFGVAYD